MNDYETGREIARRGNFLNPAASEEVKRGYVDEMNRLAQQVKAWRQTRQQTQSQPRSA